MDAVVFPYAMIYISVKVVYADDILNLPVSAAVLTWRHAAPLPDGGLKENWKNAFHYKAKKQKQNKTKTFAQGFSPPD